MCPEGELNKNFKVLYIVGAGNSGTTLLSRVLGSHDAIRNIGELNNLSRYYSQELECACGDQLTQCSYWTKINKDLYDSPISLDRSFKSKLKLLVFFKILGRTGKATSSLQDLNELYKEIFLSEQENVVVDSSKDVIRLLYMCNSSPFNIVPVYLVRDGRAYIDSYLQRGGKSTIKGYLQWLAMNLMTLVVINRVRNSHPSIRISYNDLVCNPETVVKALCCKAGILYDENMLDYAEKVSHAIAGTRSKSLGGAIQPHEKWRSRLSKKDLFLFSLLGGRLMNRFFGA